MSSKLPGLQGLDREVVGPLLAHLARKEELVRERTRIELEISVIDERIKTLLEHDQANCLKHNVV